jgi:hypothetical protein
MIAPDKNPEARKAKKVKSVFIVNPFGVKMENIFIFHSLFNYGKDGKSHLL